MFKPGHLLQVATHVTNRQNTNLKQSYSFEMLVIRNIMLAPNKTGNFRNVCIRDDVTIRDLQTFKFAHLT